MQYNAPKVVLKYIILMYTSKKINFRQAVAEVLNVGLSRAEVEADIEIVQGSVIEQPKVSSSIVLENYVY